MKLKQKILHFCEIMLMLLFMWVLSQVPGAFVNVIEWIAYILLGIVVCVWLGIFVYRYRKISLGVFLLLFGQMAYAGTLADCDEIADAAEQNLCRYEVLESNYGSSICSYMKSFDPRNDIKSDAGVSELATYVQRADELIAANRLLSAGLQADMDQCTMPDSDSLSARVSAWHANSTPFCCAFAMQQLNQIYASTHAKTRVKTVLGVMADDAMSCWPCDVIYLMTQVINTVVWNAQPFMAAAGMFLIQWIFVFWLLFQVAFVFLGRQGAADFFKAFLLQLLIVMLVAIILVPASLQVGSKKRLDTFLDEAYTWVINPPFELVLGTGIRLTQALINGKEGFNDRLIQAGMNSPNATDRENARKLQRANYCTNWQAIEKGSMYEKLLDKVRTSGFDLNSAKGRILSLDLTGGMLCLTQAAFTGLSSIGAAGSVLVSYSIENSYRIPFFPDVIPRFKPLIIGFMLQIICWFIGLEVAFQLMDVVLRMAFVLILTPVFIATAAFSVSREYSILACRFFWGTLMRFIEVALAVAIMLPFFFSSLGGSDGDKLIKAMIAPSSETYVKNLGNALTQGGFFLFFTILGIGWLAFHMLKVTQLIFEDIFGLEQVAPKSDRFFNIGQGTVQGVMTGARQSIGAMAPIAKNMGSVAKSMGSMAKNSKLGQKIGTKGRNLGNRIAGSNFGRGVTRMASTTARTGRRWAGAAAHAVATHGGSRVASAARAFAGTKIGGMAVRGGKALGRVASPSKAAKGLGKLTANVAKTAIKRFFFIPDDDKKEK